MTKWYSRLVRRPVVIVTKQDKSYRGFIQDADHHSLVLAGVEVLPEKGEPVQVPTPMLFFRDNIECIQMLEAAA